MLSNFLLYKYNDQVFSLVRGLGIYKKVDFFPLLDFSLDSRGIDPAFRVLLSWLSQFINPVLLNNLLAIVSLALTFYFSYLLFEFVTKNKHVSLAFALFNSTSLYFIYRVISATPNLYFVFVFPLVFWMLLKGKKPAILAVLTFLTFGVTSYYAFFISIIIGLWYLAELLVKETKLNEFIRKEATFFFTLVLGLIVFYPRLLLPNVAFLNPGYNESAKEEVVYRPIEDWYNFSFRPWYFVLPPETSILFGNFSSSIYDKIRGTGNYLTNDYTADEMGGTYMGWHWIVGLGVLLYTFRPLTKDQKKFLILVGGILLITLPPSFTISGVEIYTPSYFLYQVVPAFRTLVRWSAVIYLVLLVLNSYLFTKLGVKKTLVLVVLNTLLFAIHLPVIDTSTPPAEIAYLRNVGEKPATILVYPDANFYSVFWTLSHENAILNPNVAAEYREDLNEELVTREALSGKSDYKFDYIVVYFDRITDKQLSTLLPPESGVKSMESLNDYLIANLGEKVYEDSSAAIYKVNK